MALWAYCKCEQKHATVCMLQFTLNFNAVGETDSCLCPYIAVGINVENHWSYVSAAVRMRSETQNVKFARLKLKDEKHFVPAVEESKQETVLFSKEQAPGVEYP